MTILDFLTPILVIVCGLSTQGGSLTIDNQLVIIANGKYPHDKNSFPQFVLN